MESRAGEVAGDEGAVMHLSIFIRVCVTEAESMATALSRSPLYVRGGRLHAFGKLLVAHSTHRQEDMTCAVLWHTARERFKRVGLLVRGLPRRQGRLWGWAAQGRKGLTGQGWVGEGSYLGGKASWGWATEKRGAKVRCVASST